MLIQGQVDGRLESALEVELPLVDPRLRREGLVGATQMGITDGSHSHGTSKPEGCDQTRDHAVTPSSLKRDAMVPYTGMLSGLCANSS